MVSNKWPGYLIAKERPGNISNYRSTEKLLWNPISLPSALNNLPPRFCEFHTSSAVLCCTILYCRYKSEESRTGRTRLTAPRRLQREF